MRIILEGRLDTYEFTPHDRSTFIGRGGMSNVFKGIRRSDNLEVAIKVLHSNLQESAYVQFLNVIGATVRIQHQNIMKMFEVVNQNGISHIVCKFYSGRLLSNLIESGDSKKTGKREKWKIISGVLDGLSALHSNYPMIIHRDIKPSNILVCKDFTPIILDFGISKVNVQHIGNQPQFIERSDGTPEFSAPEQLKGNTTFPNSDLYAAGVTFHRLLSGSNKSSISSALNNISAQNVIEPNVNISSRVYSILKKATATNPMDRYQDALSMRSDLGNIFNRSTWITKLRNLI